MGKTRYCKDFSSYFYYCLFWFVCWWLKTYLSLLKSISFIMPIPLNLCCADKAFTNLKWISIFKVPTSLVLSSVCAVGGGCRLRHRSTSYVHLFTYFLASYVGIQPRCVNRCKANAPRAAHPASPPLLPRNCLLYTDRSHQRHATLLDTYWFRSLCSLQPWKDMTFHKCRKTLLFICTRALMHLLFYKL